MATPAIELKNISKTFGSVKANQNVNLTVNNGEILSLLGENGSGKTTLMNMISGIYFPDDGQIFIDGKEVVIRSPKDAFNYKIGISSLLISSPQPKTLFSASRRKASITSKRLPSALPKSAQNTALKLTR